MRGATLPLKSVNPSQHFDKLLLKWFNRALGVNCLLFNFLAWQAVFLVARMWGDCQAVSERQGETKGSRYRKLYIL